MSGGQSDRDGASGDTSDGDSFNGTNNDDDDSDLYTVDDADLYTWQYHGNESTVRSSRAASAPDYYPSAAWRPLSQPNQFRVLKIEEAESKHDHISVKLVTRTLDDVGEYYALSYTWGAEDFTHSVQCGDYTVPVTANLHAALAETRSLFYTNKRDTERKPNPRFHSLPIQAQPYIWADAVRCS